MGGVSMILPGFMMFWGSKAFLTLAEGVVDIGAEHLLGPDAADDAVAVLAAEGAAEFLDEVGDFRGDGGHGVEALLGFEADEGADVEAADAGVAVVAGGGAVVADDFVEAADELAEMLGVDGGVFDEGDGFGVAADAHKEAEAGFADGPDVGLRGGVEDGYAVVAEAAAGQGILQILGLGVAASFWSVAGEFDYQDGAGLAVDEGHAAGEGGGFAGAFQQHLADKLDGGGAVFEDGGGGVASLSEGFEVGDGEGGGVGRGDEVDFGFGDDAEGAFGADHHLAEVDGGAVQELVEVVAADAAHDVGVAGGYFVEVVEGDLGNGAVDLGFEGVGGQLGFEFMGSEVGQAGL